jgi:hypothetical protein
LTELAARSVINNFMKVRTNEMLLFSVSSAMHHGTFSNGSRGERIARRDQRGRRRNSLPNPRVFGTKKSIFLDLTSCLNRISLIGNICLVSRISFLDIR